jgi:hypothetical protein
VSKDYRYEVKFVIGEDKLPEVKEWIVNHTNFCKSYPDRQVNSVYFDDLDFSSVRDNLAGVPDRVKNRLRWYGFIDFENKTTPILEQKIRSGRVGTKIKTPMPILKNKLESLSVSSIRKMIVKECKHDNYFLTNYFIPILYVKYSRKYYEDSLGIRLTIDSDICFSRLRLNSSLTNQAKLQYSKQIIEIKFDRSMKNHVAKLLSCLSLSPQRHSKYLMGLAKFNEVQYF